MMLRLISYIHTVFIPCFYNSFPFFSSFNVKVRSYALVMGLGKPDPRAMSETIDYMEHNEQALSQVIETGKPLHQK
jgi:hypothetical protein